MVRLLLHRGWPAGAAGETWSHHWRGRGRDGGFARMARRLRIRSRNVHGRSSHSNRRERLYARRRRLHARVVNVRNDNHHKATTAISKSCGRVVVETLNVSGMMRNRKLARAIADAGMSGFLSKLCAHCGWKNDDLHLGDRQWWCGGCGAFNERDHNAAVNLSNWQGLSFPVSGRGDRVSPATPAVVGEASKDYALYDCHGTSAR